MVSPLWHALYETLLIAAVASLAGTGPYLLLAGRRWALPRLALPAILTSGLGLCSVVAVSVIRADGSIRLVVPIALALSAAAAAAAITWRRGALGAYLVPSRDDAVFTILALSAAVAALWPSIEAGGMQPYRVGVDEVGYAITGQYVRDGGTTAALRRAVLRETGQPTLAEALAANVTSLDLNVEITTEFILKSQRYGYSGMLGAIDRFIGEKHVESNQCLFLIFPLWFLIATAAVFLEDDVGLGRTAAILWGMGLGLNCNLLNVLWEGQHAQIFSMAFSAVLFRCWWRWRQEGFALADWRVFAGDGFGLAAFAAAAVCATYFEQVIALGAVGALMLVGDLALGPRRINRGNLAVIAAFGAGFVLNGQYFLDWIPHFLAHTGNVSRGGGGFWQPQWAQPLDILGYWSMYRPAVAVFVGRSAPIALLLGLASLAVVELTLLTAWRHRARDLVFWLSPIVFIGVIFAKSFYWDHIHNYNYMKSYTFLLLPVVTLHAWTLSEVLAKSRLLRDRQGRSLGPEVLAVVPAWIIAVGIFYLGYYRTSDEVLPSGVTALSSPAAQRELHNSVVVIGGGGGIGHLLLSGYMELRWLNLGWADAYLPPHAGERILFLALKRDLPDPERVRRRYARSIVFETPDIILLDTGRVVEVPREQYAHPGLSPIDRTNPDKARYPLNLIEQWVQIVDEVMS